MNCATHPEVPAIAYCRECGKPLCEACRQQANGTIYCQEHSPLPPAPPPPTAAYTAPEPPPPPPPPPPGPAAYTAPEPDPGPSSPYSGPYTAPESSPYTAPPPPPPPPPPYPSPGSDASPGLAFMLGLIPGVGAVYNGQYVKGLIHVVILGLLIAIVNDEALSGNLQPLFGMLIAVWVFYMAFEAYHTAKKRQLGEPVDEFSSIVPRSSQPHKFPLAPTVLIAIGLIFLLHTLDILRISQMLRYWPIALIGLGVYMLYERVSGAGPSDRGTPPGGQR